MSDTEKAPDEAMEHLGNILHMLNGLAPAHRSQAYLAAIAFYNANCSGRKMSADADGFFLQLKITRASFDRAAYMRKYRQAHPGYKQKEMVRKKAGRKQGKSYSRVEQSGSSSAS